MANTCINFNAVANHGQLLQVVGSFANKAKDSTDFSNLLYAHLANTYIMSDELKQNLLFIATVLQNTPGWKAKGITSDTIKDVTDKLKIIKAKDVDEVNVVDISDLDDNGDKVKPLPVDLVNQFKGYTTLYTDFLKQFKGTIIQNTTADLTRKVIVDNDSDLNKNITNLKNTYFDILVQFLESSLGISIGVDKLFDSRGNVKKTAKEHLAKVLRIADKEFATTGVGQVDSERASGKFEVVNAFYAYTLLRGKNFDKMVKTFKEDTIEIDKRLGFLAPAHSGKYRLSAKKFVQKGLGTDRFAHSEVRAPKAARDFIESLYIETITGKKYLQYNDILHVLNKALDVRNYRNADEYDFKLVANLHRLGIDGISKLLEKLISGKLGKNLQYSQEDKQKLKVLYDKIYSPKGNSLRAIYANKYRYALVSSYNMLDNISNMLFRQNRRTYITYTANGSINEYSKNYTLNSALHYLDQFNFETNQIEHATTLIEYNSLKFANINSDTGAIETDVISLGMIVNDENGTSQKIPLTLTKEGALRYGDRPFKSEFLGMGDGAVQYPMSMEQLAAYKDDRNSFAFTKNSKVSDSVMRQRANNFISYLQFVSGMLPGVELLGKDLGLLNILYMQDREHFMTTLNKIVYSVAKSALINTEFHKSNLSENSGIQYENIAQMLQSDKYKELCNIYNVQAYIDKASGGFSVGNGSKVPQAIRTLADAAETYYGTIHGTIRNHSGTDLPVTQQEIAALKFHSNVQNLDQALSGSIITSQNERLIQPSDVHFDETNYHKQTKQTKDLEEAESNYSMFMNRFIEGLSKEHPQDRYMYTQPIVYADKTTMDVHKVWLKGWELNGKTYDFSDEKLKLDTIQDLVFDHVGDTYRQIYRQTLSDYRTLIKDHRDDFEKRINELSSITLHNKRKTFIVDGNKTQETEQDVRKRLLSYLDPANTSEETEALKAFIRNKIKQVKDEIDNAGDFEHDDLDAELAELEAQLVDVNALDTLSFDQCAELLSLITPEEFENHAWNSKVDNIQQIHIGSRTTFVVNGKSFTGCGVNSLLQYSGEFLYKDRELFGKVMQREKYKYVRDLIKSGTSFSLTHSDFKENKTLAKIIKRYDLNEWTQYGELVLAKTKDTKQNIYTLDQLEEDNVILNPILERYFLTDLLFRTSIRHATVGTELGHANGYGRIIYDSDGNIDIIRTIESEMSARNISSLKRAVGETLPMSKLTAGSIVTLPLVLNVAVMSDMKAPVFNISGESKDIDSQDGCSLLNPLTGILINLGLAGNEGGEDIKGLLRALNTKYGQAVLFKYASFSQYNERMRNSLSGDVSMLHIFKKQTDIPWHTGESLKGKESHVQYDEVDITSNLWGNTIHFKDITNQKDFFYKEGRKIYRINALTKAEGVDTYNLEIDEVTSLGGSPVTVRSFTKEGVKIGSIWQLYQALGGCYSGHFEGSNFVYDDSSLHAVVGYMNNVGIVYDKESGKRRHQSCYLDAKYVYQPLKHYFIASCINQSGCKNGGNHLNPMSAWTDDEPLHTMEVRAESWGQVQDYDHDVSVGKSVMTEFSQVMTALAAGSMMFKYNEKVFKAITGYSIKNINNLLQAVQKFMDESLNEEGKSAIYEIVGKAVIRGARKEGTMSQALIDELTQVFAKNAKSGNTDHSKDGVYIPASSPAMFPHYVVQLASVINKMSVKRKFPGLGGVMAPSYNIFTYFQLNVNNLLGIRNEAKATQSDLLKTIYSPERIESGNNVIYSLSDKSKQSNVKMNLDVSGQTTAQDQYSYYTTSIVLSQDGFLSELITDNEYSDPLNRNKQLKNVLSFISDLDVGTSFKVSNKSFISLIVDFLHKNCEGYLEQKFDTKTKTYTYTKKAVLPDTKVVKAYVDTLNYFNYSGIIHEAERKQAELLSSTSEGNSDISHLTAQRIKNSNQFKISNPNLKTIDQLSVHESIIASDENGTVGERITIDTYQKYVDVKDKYTHFYTDLSKSKNLQPSKGRFKAVNGKWYDLYDLPQVAYVFAEREKLGKKVTQETLLKHRQLLLPMLRMIDQGWVPVSESEFDEITDSSSKLKSGTQYYLKIIDQQLEDAECVLPKIYAQQFGLREGDSLYEILEKGSDFFNDRQKEIVNSVSQNTDWDLAFINADKNHRYIKFSLDRNDRKEEIEDAYIDIVKKKITNEDGQEVYEYRKVRVDANGSKLYTLQIAYKDVNADSNEELKWENYIIPLESETGDEIFYCTKPEAAVELYSKDGFKGVKVARHENQFDNVKKFVKHLSAARINIIPFDFSGVEKYKVENGRKGKKSKKEIKQEYDSITDKTLDQFQSLDELIDKIDKQTNRRINGDGIKIFNSFKLSLEMLVARIPAQSLQSFMKMRVVGFSDSNKNSIMVSHYQLWLQGSDYDIDKAYAMGYEFSNGGIFAGWSPYFDLSHKSNYMKSLELPMPSGNTVSYYDQQSDTDEDYVDITDILESEIFQQVILPTRPSKFTDQTLQAIKTLLDRIDEHKQFTFDQSLFKVDTVLPKNASKQQKQAMQKAKQQMDEYKQTCIEYLTKIINDHTTYFENAFSEGKNNPNKPSSEVVGMAYKNCISYNAQKISSSVVNILDSNAPISMDVPKEAANNSDVGQEDQTLTHLTPSYISKMIRTFGMGKDGIGIAANGEKVFFSLLYYYTDMIVKQDFSRLRKVLFDKQFTFGDSKFTRNLIANINVDYIKGVDLKVLQNSKKFIQQTIQELYAKKYDTPEDLVKSVEEQLGIGHDQALVISALLSAATDNAKELILAKIGADTNYMNMYIYCIVLGIPFNEISNFMTSPIASLIMDMGRDNMYDEFKAVFFQGDSTKGAVQLIKDGLWSIAPIELKRAMTKDAYHKYFIECSELPVNYRTLGKYTTNTRKQLKLKKFLDLHNKIVRARATVLEKVRKKLEADEAERVKLLQEAGVNKKGRKAKITTKSIYELLDEHIAKFTDQFLDIRIGGQELTNLSVLLGLNQGLPVTLEESLNKYVQIENIFINGIKYAKGVYKGLTDEEIQYATDVDIKNDFDFDRFMADAKYRDVCIKMWNNAKHTINIFEVISSIPHIWNLYNMWHASEVGKKAMTVKYSKALKMKQAIGSVKLSKGEINRLVSVLHDASAYEWVVKQQISIPIKKGQTYIKNEKMHVADIDFDMKLNSHDSMATFKYWFENYVLQNLRRSGSFDGSRTEVDVVTNQFIGNIVVSTEQNSFTGRRKPIITFNTDFKAISELGNARDIYNMIADDFAKLEDYSFQGKSYIDWFFLYNVIANKNMYGSLRIQPIFTTLKQKPELMASYDNTFGTGDYFLDDYIGTMNTEDFFMAIAPVVTPGGAAYSKSKYVRVWNTRTQCFDLYKKKVKHDSMYDLDIDYYVDTIDPEYQSTTQTVPGYTYCKSLGNFVYNSYYTFENRSSIELFNKYSLDTNDEDQLREKLRNLFNDNVLTMYVNC